MTTQQHDVIEEIKSGIYQAMEIHSTEEVWWAVQMLPSEEGPQSLVCLWIKSPVVGQYVSYSFTVHPMSLLAEESRDQIISTALQTMYAERSKALSDPPSAN